ncbi:collectrin isoform X2 [Patagioenas fasciata]|uniref:collectrin isoform X2 n=1 Tax=Patagioenas fasciata TaxID=372321 RepID=UPI003A9A4DEA
MLQVLLLTLSVVASVHAEVCRPDAQNAFKVRLSIKTALGDNAYAWDANEEYLFKAMVAFAMRRYSSKSTTQMNRNRINNAFLLSDQTLQFLKITSTLSPPVEPSTPIWLIVFGVVLCLIVAGILFLVVAGIQQRKKKNKDSTERENLEEKSEEIVTVENGIPCETLDLKAGHINGVFAADDERFTSL